MFEFVTLFLWIIGFPFFCFLMWLGTEDDPSPFWIALCILIAIFGWSYITLGGVLAVVYWAWANPWLLGKYAAYYLGAGIVWAGVKWFRFNQKELTRFNENKVAWTLEYENKKKEGYERASTFPSYVLAWKNIPPSVTQHKRQFGYWMTWWWISIFTTFVFEYIHDAIIWVWNKCKNIYQALGHMVWKGSGLLDEPQPAPKAVVTE